MTIYNWSTVFLLFSFLFLTRILILLLMSGNVHPNLCLVFPSSVCAGNMTWRGWLLQCCTRFKWIHLRCSLLSSRFKTRGSSHSRSCPPCCDSAFLQVPHLPTLCLVVWAHPACILPLFNLVHLALLCQCSATTPPSSTHILPSFLHFISPPFPPLRLLVVLLYLLLPLPPLTRSGFFNGMAEVFEPQALKTTPLCLVLFSEFFLNAGIQP